MDTFTLLVETANNLFMIWNSKLSVKYQNEFADLRKDFYEEKSKPMPDHARLDNYEFLMRNLIKRVNTEFARQNSVPKMGP